MDTRLELLQALEAQVAAKAREDINIFCEYVMRDEKGHPFRQSPVHRTWHAFIDFCQYYGKRPVILAPWGSGKSAQIAIARVLWEIGRNPNLRVKIVSNADDSAKLRVAAIGRYIMESQEYHAVFPEVERDRDAFWSAHQLFIKRGGQSVDPTVEAKGVMSTGVGSRVDLLVFDDIVDQRNAIEQPALREKVKENFANVWMSRLDLGGRAWYIATAWHADDLTSYLRYGEDKRDTYWVMSQAVSDDFKALRLEFDMSDECVGEALEYFESLDLGLIWDGDFDMPAARLE